VPLVVSSVLTSAPQLARHELLYVTGWHPRSPHDSSHRNRPQSSAKTEPRSSSTLKVQLIVSTFHDVTVALSLHRCFQDLPRPFLWRRDPRGAQLFHMLASRSAPLGRPLIIGDDGDFHLKRVPARSGTPLTLHVPAQRRARHLLRPRPRIPVDHHPRFIIAIAASTGAPPESYGRILSSVLRWAWELLDCLKLQLATAA
jgi:hypothetical protein